MAKCPYCKKEVDFKNIKKEEKGIGFLRQDTIYICPHCECIISIARGKYG